MIAFALHVALSEPVGESRQSPSQSLFTKGGIVGKKTMMALMELLKISLSFCMEIRRNNGYTRNQSVTDDVNSY